MKEKKWDRGEGKVKGVWERERVEGGVKRSIDMYSTLWQMTPTVCA